jgi:chemotaxis methyl-accepting protein methylase
MTNTTTYFFREARALRALIEVLPKRGAHVWIAGCSTGDELYSLAILATEAGCQLDITASDVNRVALNAAAAGRYRGRNLRLLDARRVELYFDKVGDDTYTIRRDRLPNIVWRFVHHDIANDPPVAPLDAIGWDAVLCRHVLVYLDDAASLRALRNMTSNLRNNGHILLA